MKYDLDLGDVLVADLVDEAASKLRIENDSLPAELDQVDKALNYVSYLPIPAGDLAPDVDWRNPDFR